jgi:hypothetical protein
MENTNRWERNTLMSAFVSKAKADWGSRSFGICVHFSMPAFLPGVSRLPLQGGSSKAQL